MSPHQLVSFWLANALVLLHVLVVGVTAAGAVAIFTGRFRRFHSRDVFQWVFMACCVGQILSLLFTGGCFLTQWEKELRNTAAPGSAYAGTFLDHYLSFLPRWVTRLLQPLSLAAIAGGLLQGLIEWRRRRVGLGQIRAARQNGKSPDSGCWRRPRNEP